MIVEPCCYRKQMDELVSGYPEVAHFFTNGDLSLPEFMDYLIGRCPGCDVFLSLVSVNECTLASVCRLLDRKLPDGSPLIRTFALLSQGKERDMVHTYLAPYCKGGRVCVCEDRESFRCLSVGNGASHFILNGSINQQPVYSMQMFTLTSSKVAYEQAMQIFGSKKRTKRVND